MKNIFSARLIGLYPIRLPQAELTVFLIISINGTFFYPLHPLLFIAAF